MQGPIRRRVRAAVGVLAAFTLVGLGLLSFSGTAGATEIQPGPVVVKVPCSTGWYVNPDEVKLAPKSMPLGLLFDGPSIVHHTTDKVSLAAVATDGAFTTWGPVTGSMPLFKLETISPYSTINKTGAGKWWSSKIATGAGSQSMPLNSPADLIGKGGYTTDTKVYSFGVGYANDKGNKALVTSITFAGHKYLLFCHRTHSPSPSPSASATPSPTPSASGTVVTSGSPSASTSTPAGLPVTGANTTGLLVAGLGALALGSAGVWLFGRRRRTRFEA